MAGKRAMWFPDGAKEMTGKVGRGDEGGKVNSLQFTMRRMRVVATDWFGDDRTRDMTTKRRQFLARSRDILSAKSAFYI